MRAVMYTYTEVHIYRNERQCECECSLRACLLACGEKKKKSSPVSGSQQFCAFCDPVKTFRCVGGTAPDEGGQREQIGGESGREREPQRAVYRFTVV